MYTNMHWIDKVVNHITTDYFLFFLKCVFNTIFFLFWFLPNCFFDFFSKNFLVLFLLFLPYFNYKYNRQTNTQNHPEYGSEIQKQ